MHHDTDMHSKYWFGDDYYTMGACAIEYWAISLILLRIYPY